MLSFVAALAVASSLVAALPTPYTPSGPQVAGTTASMCWGADPDKAWNSVQVKLMTGDNFNMKELAVIANSVDMTKDGCTPWTVPQVSQYVKAYFFQVTYQSQVQWSSRFIIANPSGQYSDAPYNTQPNGDPTPWGDGTIVNGTPSSTTSSSATSSAASSSVPTSSAPTSSKASSAASSAASRGSSAVQPSISKPAGGDDDDDCDDDEDEHHSGHGSSDSRPWSSKPTGKPTDKPTGGNTGSNGNGATSAANTRPGQNTSGASAVTVSALAAGVVAVVALLA